ncbi:MAG TPA: acetamidase/formamidase family protein, partial [Anaerolineales bacterium]|nr:acetamidase/formamidase family protein [Anaerolineales bacterium]
ILMIDPGDTIVARTLDAGWSVGPRPAAGMERPQFVGRDRARDNGHALLGPIGVRGAEPGMGLAIDLDEIVVGSWGWTVAGGWDHPINRAFDIVDGLYDFDWSLDAAAGIGRNQYGDTIRLRPFLGQLAVAPAAPGRHSTIPPRHTGGNLDCRELVAGSRLVLPIEMPLALFSFGDGHAAQGDGEVAVTAVECPLERVVLRLSLEPQPILGAPYAHTPAGWITFGLDEDLTEAAHQALAAMVTVLGALHGFDTRRALALASVAVDLRVTQIVNGVRGVHAVLADDAIGRSPRDPT